jgi:uracil-DNA glycosylase
MHPTWLDAVGDELETPPLKALRSFLVDEVAAGRGFYPPAERVFTALELTPLPDVRVVILGQDPYHGQGQAMGLCFSVPPGVTPPPSLRNIFQELRDDVGIDVSPLNGDLSPWARRGVLLLNAVLTVSPGKPASHAGHGWEGFTDRVIRELCARTDGVVFLLWGRYAQQKGAHIDAARHHVLTAAHPSPYSAASGFFGCRHFSQANAMLRAGGREPVDWTLEPAQR